MRFLKNIAWILQHGSRLGRIGMLTTYLRIAIKQTLAKRGLRAHLQSERLWDQCLAFPDYDTFAVLFEEIYLPATYEFQSRRPNPTIVDCGANIGVSVAYFSTRYPEATIDAFEADEKTFAILSENSRRNQWRHVSLHHTALHRQEGVMTFYGYEPGSLVSSFRREISGAPSARTVTVSTVRLSSFIKGPVDLLKLDIEGSESSVLEDLVQSGKLNLVDQILMEYHHHIRPDEDQLASLLGLLELSGFGYDVRAPGTLPFASGRAHNFMLYAYKKEACLAPA